MYIASADFERVLSPQQCFLPSAPFGYCFKHVKVRVREGAIRIRGQCRRENKHSNLILDRVEPPLRVIERHQRVQPLRRRSRCQADGCSSLISQMSDRALRSGGLGNPWANRGYRCEGKIAEIAGRYHHSVTLGCGGDQRVDGRQSHGSYRPARHDHAPDLCNKAIDIEDPAFEPIRQIDLQPTPQSFAARALRQLFAPPPNFSKAEDAQVEASFVLSPHPRHNIGVRIRPHQFGDDVRVEKIVRQNWISRG
jgi:hypothetical protein